MNRFGVTDEGYNVLEKTGLDKLVDRNWSCLSDEIPLTHSIDCADVEESLKTESHPDRQYAIQELLKENEFYIEETDYFMVSGKITDILLNEEERSNILTNVDNNIESLSQLDGLLAVYCLEKFDIQPTFNAKRFTWRSGQHNTQIYSNIENDMILAQTNIDAERYGLKQKKVNMVEKPVLFARLDENFISANRDYWPVLIATALKYADTLGIEIPEAQDWRGLMEEYGWDGTIERPTLSDSAYEYFVSEYRDNTLAQLPDNIDASKINKMFFGIMRPSTGHDVSYIPVIDENERLVFFANYGKGESVELAPYGDKKDYYPSIHFSKDDVSKLFEGAVHSTMMSQSSVRPEHLAFMLWQHEQLKDGLSEDEICVKTGELNYF